MREARVWSRAAAGGSDHTREGVASCKQLIPTLWAATHVHVYATCKRLRHLRVRHTVYTTGGATIFVYYPH